MVIVSKQDQHLACGPAEPLPSQESEDAWATLIGNTTLDSSLDTTSIAGSESASPRPTNIPTSRPIKANTL